MATFTSASRFREQTDDMGWRDRRIRPRGERRRRGVGQPAGEEAALGGKTIGAGRDVDEAKARTLHRSSGETLALDSEKNCTQEIKPGPGGVGQPPIKNREADD